MCKYCSNNGAIQWNSEEGDCKASASYENGVMIITDASGDYMDIDFKHCPMCGKKIIKVKGEEE